MNWRVRVLEILALTVAVAFVARVVWTLLGPLLPTLIGLLVMSCLFYFVLRRK